MNEHTWFLCLVRNSWYPSDLAAPISSMINQFHALSVAHLRSSQSTAISESVFVGAAEISCCVLTGRKTFNLSIHSRLPITFWYVSGDSLPPVERRWAWSEHYAHFPVIMRLIRTYRERYVLLHGGSAVLKLIQPVGPHHKQLDFVLSLFCQCMQRSWTLDPSPWSNRVSALKMIIFFRGFTYRRQFESVCRCGVAYE